MRQLQRLCLVCIAGLLVPACGGQKEQLKGLSRPARLADDAEFYLQGLKKKLAKPDYTPVDEPAIGMSYDLVHRTLPGVVRTKVTDKAVRDPVLAKLEQLRKLFDEQVWQPVQDEPRDLAKASAGVDECLKLVRQIKQLLGS